MSLPRSEVENSILKLVHNAFGSSGFLERARRGKSTFLDFNSAVIDAVGGGGGGDGGGSGGDDIGIAVRGFIARFISSSHSIRFVKAFWNLVLITFCLAVNVDTSFSLIFDDFENRFTRVRLFIYEFAGTD